MFETTQKSQKSRNLANFWILIIFILPVLADYSEEVLYQVSFQNHTQLEFLPISVLNKFQYFVDLIKNKEYCEEVVIESKGEYEPFKLVSDCYTHPNKTPENDISLEIWQNFLEGLKVYRPIDPDFVCLNAYKNLLTISKGKGIILVSTTNIENKEKYTDQMKQLLRSIINDVSRKLGVKNFLKNGSFANLTKEGLSNIQISDIDDPLKKIILGYDLLHRVCEYKKMGDVHTHEVFLYSLSVMALLKLENIMANTELSVLYRGISRRNSIPENRMMLSIDFMGYYVETAERVVKLGFEGCLISKATLEFLQNVFGIRTLYFKCCILERDFADLLLDIQKKSPKISCISIEDCYFKDNQIYLTILNKLDTFSYLHNDRNSCLILYNLSFLNKSYNTLKKLSIFIDDKSSSILNTIKSFTRLHYLELRMYIPNYTTQRFCIDQINSILSKLRLTEIKIEVLMGIIQLSRLFFNLCKTLKVIKLIGIVFDTSIIISQRVEKLVVSNAMFFNQEGIEVVSDQNIEIELRNFKIYMPRIKDKIISDWVLRNIVELSLCFEFSMHRYFKKQLTLSSCQRLHLKGNDCIAMYSFILNLTLPALKTLILEKIEDVKLFIVFFSHVAELILHDCPNLTLNEFVDYNDFKTSLVKLEITNHKKFNDLNLDEILKLEALKYLHIEGYVSDRTKYDELFDMHELHERLDIFFINVFVC